MIAEIATKAAVSVSEMARMVGLRRARFYQLQGTKFPMPVYDVQTRRPVYTEELQQVCLEVRRRNCGIDGKPVLFYAQRPRTVSAPKPRRKPSQVKKGEYDDIVDGVRALGLTWATAALVEAAASARYKTGTEGVDRVEVIRDIFLDLKRQDHAGNAER